MAPLIIAAVGASLAAGCARKVEVPPPPPRVEASVYCPLALGNRWTYEASFLGEQRRHVVELVKQDQGFFVDNGGNRLAVDAFGVRDEKRYLLREPLEAGRTWTNVVSVSSVEHYQILEVGQSCQAPAGRFDDCVRVEGRNRVDDQTTLVNEMTFAAGVGLVRVRVTAETQGKQIPQTELSLKEFSLSPDGSR